MEVACITLWQPYASLIFTAPPLKQFETRGFRFPAKLAGRRLAIHAAKRMLAKCGVSPALHELCLAELGPEYERDLPRGALLGTVRLVECAPVEKYREQISAEDYAAGDWSDGRYCWLLAEPLPLAHPRPMKGKQGWSTVTL